MPPARPPFRPRPFHPARWLPGPHAQTVAGRYLRPLHGVRLRRERIGTPDGDFLDLDWAEVEGSRPGAGSPLVLVLHGLEGSTRSAYVLETFRALAARGMRGVGLNFRTCGGEMNRAARMYHAGDSEDPAFVLGILAGRFPDAPLGAVGYSLGGNMLLKHLGEAGAATRVRAAAAVSVPYDLAGGTAKLEGSVMGRLYLGIFLRSLKEKMRLRRDVLADACDVPRALAARTLREFDDAATAPLHGFRDAAHYYEESSSGRFLDRIRVPTLLLHAEDDPFLPPERVPRGAASANPALVEAFTPRGGHVGFVAGPPWAPVYWAERAAARFLAGHLHETRGAPEPARETR